ncbi:MAG: hypothetical protein ACJA0Q_001435 [Saprospiraceae bacterium]|jgi:hypothetical protein
MHSVRFALLNLTFFFCHFPWRGLLWARSWPFFFLDKKETKGKPSTSKTTSKPFHFLGKGQHPMQISFSLSSFLRPKKYQGAGASFLTNGLTHTVNFFCDDFRFENKRYIVYLSFSQGKTTMRSALLLLTFVITSNCIAQEDFKHKGSKEPVKSYGVYLQYNGILKPYVEFGIGKSKEVPTHHGPISSGAYLSSEIKIDFNRTVIAPKFGLWVHGGMILVSCGVNILYYTDVSNFSQGSPRIRPELGLGAYDLRAYLGVNIPLWNYQSSKEYVSLFTIGIMYYMPVVTRKSDKSS